mmetsp:Transcript_43433/g.102582  ORF Transcript_43433/g.102582 Transcript_43433/m.102582 type:complete len:174 (-) Transcript_43433:172-693(-)
MVFIPILSWQENGKGSLGGMALLDCDDPDSRVDNVLLEFVIALALRDWDEGAIKAIMPLMVGPKRDDSDGFASFPFAKLGTLPTKAHTPTNEFAAFILRKLGMPQRLITRIADWSVKDVVDRILQNQGVQFADFPSKREAVQTSASLPPFMLRLPPIMLHLHLCFWPAMHECL